MQLKWVLQNLHYTNSPLPLETYAKPSSHSISMFKTNRKLFDADAEKTWKEIKRHKKILRNDFLKSKNCFKFVASFKIPFEPKLMKSSSKGRKNTFYKTNSDQGSIF